jgi:uncharacterized protein (DUF983 family)
MKLSGALGRDVLTFCKTLRMGLNGRCGRLGENNLFELYEPLAY